MLGSNHWYILRVWHWQSDALTTRLDLIHYSARYHPLFLYAGTNLITRPVLFCSYSNSVPLIPCCFLVQGLFILFLLCSCSSSLALSFFVLLQGLFLKSCLFPVQSSFLLSRLCVPVIMSLFLYKQDPLSRLWPFSRSSPLSLLRSFPGFILLAIVVVQRYVTCVAYALFLCCPESFCVFRPCSCSRFWSRCLVFVPPVQDSVPDS